MDERIFRHLKGMGVPGEDAEIDSWRAASPKNEERYRILDAILARYSELEGRRRLPVAPSAAQLSARAKWLGQRERIRPRPFGRFGRGLLSAGGAAVAAGAVAAGAVATLIERPSAVEGGQPILGAEEFVTGRDELAAIQLRDGTVVRLGPGSRLEVAASADQREVRLTGRAYFAVAEAGGRWFTIRTPTREVRVLGTRFDVEARERDLQLLVVEGVVEVRDEVSARARVEAGELYTVMDGRELPAASVPDALPLMGWAGNFMAFQSTPLADAVLEIERQYGVRIEILDPVLATRMITAWFTDRPLEEVLRVVCLAVAAQCKSVDGVILMNEQTGGAREPSLRREISDKEELIP